MVFDRKKPGVAFWATVVVVVVLVAYPLSVGPADWLRFHGPFFGSQAYCDVYDAVYRPLDFLAEQSEGAHQALWWYRRLFVSESYLEQLILSDTCHR